MKKMILYFMGLIVHRHTLHVPPPLAQWPQYLQFLQAVQVPLLPAQAPAWMEKGTSREAKKAIGRRRAFIGRDDVRTLLGRLGYSKENLVARI